MLEIQSNSCSSTEPLYKLWPGNNSFLCKGYLILGPKGKHCRSICTFLTITVLEFLFLFLISPFLWATIHPILPILSLYFYLCSTIFSLITAFSDPGIIPRKEIFKLMGYVPDIFTIEGTEPKRKFCKTCNIYRPPRSSHCRDCDNCVEMFDHHCPYINNCIGKNNYK